MCGPLIDADAYERVRRYQSLAHEEGRRRRRARRHARRRVVRRAHGRRHRRPAGSRIATDEIFGPVLTMLRATDFDHALALANDTDYALTAGLFSRSPSRIAHATRLAPGGERVREPGHHGRARRTPAVRRLRALRRRLQGGRARLPAAVRRVPRGHREHHPAGLRTTTGRTRLSDGQAGRRGRCSIVASAPG